MCLTFLWLKSNSKATQCNVRIVLWIHDSSETQNRHQAFTPLPKREKYDYKYDWFQKKVFLHSQGEHSNFLKYDKKYDGNMMEIQLEIWFQNHGVCQGCLHSEQVENAKRHISHSFNEIFWQTQSPNLKNVVVQINNVFVKISKCICQNPHKVAFIHMLRMQSTISTFLQWDFLKSAIGQGNRFIWFKSQSVCVWMHLLRLIPVA